MHKPESILEKKIHKIIRTFEMQTDHLILSRRPNLVIIKLKKKTYWKVNPNQLGRSQR